MASDEIVLDREAFKALAADSRVAILKKLSSRRMTGSELSGEMGFSASTVKEHLDNLEKVGLVEKIEDGSRKWKYFELTAKGRRIVEPTGVPAQVWLVLGLFLIALVLSVPFLQPPQAASPPAFGQEDAFALNAPSAKQALPDVIAPAIDNTGDGAPMGARAFIESAVPVASPLPADGGNQTNSTAGK